MMKEKRSFLEKLTGSRKIDESEPLNNSMPIYSDDEESESLSMNSHSNPSSAMNISQNPMTTGEDQWQQPSSDGEGQLTIDVYQTETDIVIKSTIAGVKPEDLDVAINSDMITIKGERRNDEAVNPEHYYYQECYWGSFSRSVVLPVDVISEKAEASLKNGILTIRLPKAEINKTKRIQVRGF